MPLSNPQSIAVRPDPALSLALGRRLDVDYPRMDGLSFSSLPVDLSLGDAPTFCAAVKDGDADVATYKFNLFDYGDDAVGDVLLASPLVIIWAQDGAARKPGMDKTIARHAVACLQGFLRHDAMQKNAAFLSSGYLTTQRKGRDFFASLGWDVHLQPRENGGFRHAGFAPHLLLLADHIDAISFPYRTDPVEAGNIHFAVLKVLP